MSQTETNWEDEFDTEFEVHGFNNLLERVSPAKIKDFIRNVHTQAINSERERIAKGIESIKAHYPIEATTLDNFKQAMNWANPVVHQVLNDTVSLLHPTPTNPN